MPLAMFRAVACVGGHSRKELFSQAGPIFFHGRQICCFRKKQQTDAVKLANGSKLIGEVLASGCRVYRDIPFAEAPIGQLRFAPPVPKLPWGEIRDCSGKHSVACFQLVAPITEFINRLLAGCGTSRLKQQLFNVMSKVVPMSTPEGEDCLKLWIAAPPSKRSPHAVMVWIHGGNHQDGSSSENIYTDPEDTLSMEGDVVLVCLNYRLNVFGYFAHPELSAECAPCVVANEAPVGGDAGHRDILFALHWVQKNIATFGGDASNVTIFGEAAGGRSVLQLMATPAANGLFHKAIAQSPNNGGKCVKRTKGVGSHDAAEALGVRFADGLVGTEPGQLQRLRSLPAAEIQVAYKQFQIATAANEEKGPGFYPVCGDDRGETAVIRREPFAAFASAVQHAVPLIIGSCADEGSVIKNLSRGWGAKIAAQNEAMPCEAAAWSPETAAQEDAQYSPESAKRLLAISPGIDGAFWYAHSVAQAHVAAGFPTYMYHFGRVPASPSQLAAAYHAAELSFIFGTSALKVIDPMDSEDVALGVLMRRHWASFAATGDPSPAAGLHWGRCVSAEGPQMAFFKSQSGMVKLDSADKFTLLCQPLGRIVE